MDTTLLLNASYEPLKVIPWQRAITLLFLGKVEVIDEYHREVRSVSLALKVPAVVRLLTYVRLAKRRPPLSKSNLYNRDNGQCQYCAKYLQRNEATTDHVIPRSQGGATTWINVVLACPPCNRRKGGRTPKQANMKLKIPPRAPEWLPVLQVRFNRNIPSSWKVFLVQTKKKKI